MIRCTIFCSVALAALTVGQAGFAGTVIRGSVLDSNNQPVAEADIWLVANAVYLVDQIKGRTTTDASGQFQLEVPDEWKSTDPLFRGDCAFIAHRKEAGFAVAGLGRNSPLPASVKLVLEAAREITTTVLTADGNPLASARVAVSGVQCQPLTSNSATYALADKTSFSVPSYPFTITLPEELTERFAASTGVNGTAVVPAPPLNLTSVEVDSKQTGQHSIQLYRSNRSEMDDWPATLKLPAVGRVKGRLVSEPSAAAAGVKLSFSVNQAFETTPSGSQLIVGLASVTTDQEGSFDVPAISSGQLQLQAESTAYPNHRPRLSRLPMLIAGQTVELDIPWSHGVRVHGLVRESKTKVPVADTALMIINAGKYLRVTTDGEGRYEAIMAPGALFVYVTGQLPENPDSMRNRLQTIPDDAMEFHHPIEVRRWAQVAGRVVDVDGQGVAGANVLAFWTGITASSQTGTLTRADVQTDADGRFVIGTVDPSAKVSILAEHAGAVIKQPVLAAASDKNVTVRISEANSVALTGRVVDANGDPVAGVLLKVERIRLGSQTTEYESAFDDMPIRTGPDGRYQTPKTLVPFAFYRIVARAGSENQVTTAGQDIARKTEFPDLEVNSLSSIKGQVVDRDATPVQSATVVYVGRRVTLTATTDEDGRFELQDAELGTGFLVISHEGFRTFGERLQEAGDRSIKLIHYNDPAPQRTRVTTPLTEEERRALALRVLEPLWTDDDEASRARALQELGAIDPDRALDELEKNPFKNSQYSDMVRGRIVRALAKDRTEEALAVAETIGFTVFRAQSMVQVADSLADEQREQKLKILAQALVSGRAEKNPVMRLHAFGLVGERLLDLGEREQAVKVLREGEKIAEQLSTSAFAGFSRGAFAEELAQIDLDAALKLCAGLSDPDEFNRHHGNIAHELAAVDPEAAERVLGLMKKSAKNYIIPPREEKSVRVCYRMVRVDQPRAERLADSIKTLAIQAYAKGLMAQSLFETHPSEHAAAQHLLLEAFEVLDKAPKSHGATHVYAPSTIAAALLGVVEQVDPNHFDHYFWKTLTLRRPILDEEQFASSDYDQLAMLLSPLDVEVATTVLDWIPKQQSQPGRSYLPAKTLLRPQQTVTEAENSQDRLAGQNRTIVAAFLTSTGPALDRVIRDSAALWYPDVEDSGL